MINSLIVFLFSILLFIVVDFKKLKESNKLSRWTYFLVLSLGLSIIIYMEQTMDPFRPASWIYYKVQTFLHH